MENEDLMKLMQKHLGYNDAEAKLFCDNQRNADLVSKAEAMMNKTIVIEVVESHGCNSHHKTGDKFYFDGVGNLITKLSPKKICCFALEPMAKLIFGAHELFYPVLIRTKCASSAQAALM